MPSLSPLPMPHHVNATSSLLMKRSLAQERSNLPPVGQLVTEEARMGKECIQPHENAGHHLHPSMAPELTSATRGLAVPSPSSRLAPGHHIRFSHFSFPDSLEGHSAISHFPTSPIPFPKRWGLNTIKHDLICFPLMTGPRY